ncbi:MAG: prepilin-type N-terminal cleavage/methylation domain-containing protein [Burkholderiaceae bacterium]|nr:MAG: prepilin-type N-terminal cleavage/methylation domain-containing protein [Burkholderiaceae bacterium]
MNTIKFHQPRHLQASKAKQKGLTLIELIVAIAIGLIILAAAAAGISKGFGASDVGADTDHINTLLVNVRDDLRSVNGYGPAGTDLVPSLRTAGGIPSDMTITANVPYNAWNGPVGITSTGLGYQLTSANIPADACVKEATKLSRPGTVTTSINGGAAITGAVPVTTATSQCSGTANTLTFVSSN